VPTRGKESKDSNMLLSVLKDDRGKAKENEEDCSHRKEKVRVNNREPRNNSIENYRINFVKGKRIQHFDPTYYNTVAHMLNTLGRPVVITYLAKPPFVTEVSKRKRSS
jgi:hypothetical protein